MIYIDPIFAEYLYRRLAGTVEELSIVRDDDISSFPGMFEIVLEPLHRDEIDEVSWLIEEEEIWFR